MASIRCLLDTFGPPPREICLDWAYQIQAAAAGLASAAAVPGGAGAARSAAPAVAHWTSWEVASDGSLRLDGLTASMARQALQELHEWASGDASGHERASEETLEAPEREIEPSAETFGACGSLDQLNSNCESFQARAIRTRSAQRRPTWLTNRRTSLTAAAALLAVPALLAATATMLLVLRSDEKVSMPTAATELENAITDPNSSPTANSTSAARAAAVDVDDDFLSRPDAEPLDDGWTTSAELTSGALSATSAESNKDKALAAPAAFALPLEASLAIRPTAQGTTAAPSSTAPTTPANSVAVQQGSQDTRELEAETHVDSAKQPPASEVDDVMAQVATAVAEAEMQSRNVATDAAKDKADAVVDTNSEPGSTDAQDHTHQPALMLTRDASVLRCQLPRGLRRPREPHWTARVELPKGFLVEPAAVQFVDDQAGAQWRIYPENAQSPRVCLVVSVHRRSGRNLGLDWSIRGSAEDLPNLRLPLARKWLDALSAQLKVTAASLQAVAESPAQSVPRELRAVVQNGRQLARKQLALAQRLVTLLAEVDRMASLLDDELLGHAELRERDGGTLLAAYGSCELELAKVEVEVTTAN